MKRKHLKLVTAATLTALSVSIFAGCGAKNQTPAYDTISHEAGNSTAPVIAAETAAADLESAAGDLTSGSGISQVPDNRKLIRAAHLTVESTEFDALLANINQSVAALGGYLEQADISGSSISASINSRRDAYMVARIPSDKFNQFITQVGEQGNITSKSESTQDVTLQYSDVESRKKSLTIEQERIWALLEKADTLEAVIALESRLSEIRYQLESLESQLRLYDNQVDYSSVTLNISEVQVFTPTSPDSVLTRIEKGFNRNLTAVGSSLVNFIVWFLSSIPVLVLLGVIIAIITLIVKIVNKKGGFGSGRSSKKKLKAAETKDSSANDS